MPHCQKESHDHSSKSKKAKQKKALEKAAKKQEALDAAKKKEEEELLKPNNMPLVEGFGEYEIGCVPEREYKFNSKKRSKKHLRNDIRANERREESDLKKKEVEEKHRQLKKDQPSSESESEEEPIIEEILIYICSCCKKKFGTSNQFLNHSHSLKHRRNARPYEDVGVPVTEVEIKDEGNNFDLNDEEEEGEEEEDGDEGLLEVLEDEGLFVDEEEEEDEESEEEPEVVSKPSMFAAFGDDSSSSSSSSSESEHEEEEEEEEEGGGDGGGKLPPAPLELEEEEEEEENEDAVFQQIIDENDALIESQAQAQAQALNSEQNGTIAILPPSPPPTPLDIDTTFDPSSYDANTARDLSVLSRLQKKLAEQGKHPHQTLESYAENSISIGKTLLQKVMTAKHDNLEARLAAYNAHKKECQLLNREFALSKGVSKALPAQYARKQFTADNARTRENIHHTGSHYVMAASRGMYHGRKKGLVARHSSQGARLQASRMQAKETQRMQTGGGGKVGKTGKKSKQKSSGNAGGSKKNGEGGGEK